MEEEKSDLQRRIEESMQKLEAAGIKRIPEDRWKEFQASRGIFSATPMNYFHGRKPEPAIDGDEPSKESKE
jgi:hypothetical protein